MKEKKIKPLLIILGGLVLYLASAGISFAAFKYLGGVSPQALLSPVSIKEARFKVDPTAPKTEACPLNGKLFTKVEKQIWEKRRPLTVMIENHSDARPQSGLSKTDVIYEAVAEGGITRLLAVYYCGAAAEDTIIGPVRSARTYFLDFASEYGDFPLYAHVGGANKPGPADALSQIGKYGWLAKGNDMNQFALGFPVYWRDYERIGHPVATEHTMYSSTDKLWEVAHDRGLDATDEEGNQWDKNFKAWPFKDDSGVDQRGTVGVIKFNFWSGYGDYAVEWRYDSTTNEYARSNGGQPQKDLNNQQQLRAKTVAIEFMKEKGPIDEVKHLLYTTVGKGPALIFFDGQAIEANWVKKDRQSRTTFLDSKGKEIKFNQGQIWIEILPLGTKVEY